MRITIDKFNSDVFGLKMGNVDYSKNKEITLEDMNTLQVDAIKEGFQHLTIRIASMDKKNLNTVLESGYVFADTRVEYFFDFNHAKLPAINHKCVLREANQADLDILKHIARVSFSLDRFHSDANLDNLLCDKYYELWLENSFYGFADKIIVAEYQGKPVGFTTGKVFKETQSSQLVLSAVSDSCRGLGIYTSMIHAGVSWLLKEHGDVGGVLVGTQLENLAVQKAWIKLGFTVINSFYILQKYLGE